SISRQRTPWPIAIAFAAPFAGRLADRIAAPILATVGLGIFALGLVALATLPPHAQPLDIVLRAIVCGLGFGFFQAPNNRELLGSAPRARSGSASGILATARVTGQSLGAALVAIALGTAAAGATLGAGHIDLALDGPVRFALALAAAVAALAALVSAFRLRGDLALRVHP
ncbi:MAG: MFS transporter, partial [Vulcanimicrobiaceae bacterium]